MCANQHEVQAHVVNHSSHQFYCVENTALILVDHQVGTIGWAGELSGDAEREQLRMWLRVITRFAVKGGMPVVLTSSMEDQAQGP